MSTIRARMMRLSILGVTVLGLSAAMLVYAGHSRGGVATAQASSKVAVIPGFDPPNYAGTVGVPQLPIGSPRLSAYHFSELTAAQITTAALAHYDTVILYGIRWSDLSAGRAERDQHVRQDRQGDDLGRR